MQLLAHVPLAPLTSFGIGGPAQYLVRAESESDIEDALEWARSRSLAVFVLGGGSNLLISDEGFPGLVLQPLLRGIERQDISSGSDAGADLVELRAAAGEDWDAFVAYCVENGLAGLECLSGIPGWVGGTPVQNVGAYGQEVDQCIASVRAWDRQEHRWVELPREQCGFTYRASIFNTSARERYVVTEVRFRLRLHAPPSVRYAELANLLRDAGASLPTLRQVRAAVRDLRRGKAMLIDPGLPESRSAGSFFKNPIVSEAEADRIAVIAGKRPPQFPVPGAPQMAKLAAAWLIEQAGLSKGYRPQRNGVPGPVGISSRHALALVNYGGASAADVLALKEEVQRRVLDRFGIHLQPEPVMVGFEKQP